MRGQIGLPLGRRPACPGVRSCEMLVLTGQWSASPWLPVKVMPSRWNKERFFSIATMAIPSLGSCVCCHSSRAPARHDRPSVSLIQPPSPSPTAETLHLPPPIQRPPLTRSASQPPTCADADTVSPSPVHPLRIIPSSLVARCPALPCKSTQAHALWDENPVNSSGEPYRRLRFCPSLQ